MKRNNGDVPTAQAPVSIPLFQYKPPRCEENNFGAVMMNREVFHRIENMQDFYAALGYGKDAIEQGLIGEEFVWERYTRVGASKSRQCLQDQISAYLNAHCADFKKSFGDFHNESTGKCALDVMDPRDGHCCNCSKHPKTSASVCADPQ